MAGDSVIAEALARIEHKVDLLLTMIAGTGVQLRPVADSNHTCPVCSQPVTYAVDLMNKVVKRMCACSTGKQAPMDMSELLAKPLAKPRSEDTDGRDANQDGSNTTRGSRPQRR